MKLKLSDYPHSKEALRRILNARPETSRIFLAAEFSACDGTPLIVTYIFMHDIMGATPETTQKLQELMDFYEVEEVFI